MKRLATILCIVALLFLGSGCFFDPSEDQEFSYDRKTVESWVNDNFFGYSKDDIEIMAVDYLYHQADLVDQYGESFEIEASGVGGIAEMESVLWFYKGTARMLIDIGNDTWIVELSKSYFHKWSVTGCYQEEQEE